MTSSPIAAARSQYLLDLLAQVPDPRKRRGRRHPLAGLLAVGVAAVIAGSIDIMVPVHVRRPGESLYDGDSHYMYVRIREVLHRQGVWQTARA